MSPSASEYGSTPVDLAEIGKLEIAYVKPARSDGIDGFAIFGADGKVIGFAPERDLAIAAIMQNGMELVSVH
jgi:hypothetical protein